MNSSKPYSDSPNPTRALLSIKPKFAYAILRGEKKYEFRRSIFARPVRVVLLYASAPVRRVVAEFEVRSIISQPLQTLWNRTKIFAGIGEEFFFRYFHGREYGHAIEIGEVRPYKAPFCPVERFGIKPPQSFVYIDFDPSIEAQVGLIPLTPTTIPPSFHPLPFNAPKDSPDS